MGVDECGNESYEDEADVFLGERRGYLGRLERENFFGAQSCHELCEVLRVVSVRSD